MVMADGSKKDVAIWRRRVIDEDGNVRFVKEPLEKVGMGHYRSARKNALRLMRTEINASYHNANYERWQQEPFVIGIRIFLSPQHPDYDECDELAGNYPKDFYWTGWHPQCYSDDTKVLTDAGWKLFADVSDNDRILSLNPETRAIEYVGIKDRQKWWKEGSMIHFSNRALDCLVTPEHRMVYLGKTNGDIKYCYAEEYTQGKGAFYRGCVYAADDVASILIGEKHYDFDTFCEFMGYYLSDGSLIRSRQVVISQQDGQPHKGDIIDCIERMGFDVTTSRDFVNFYDTAFCSYLHQFGTSNAKFIPGEIKNASSRQIGIFLDAFARCDGHIKKPHSFVGNHGNVCVPKRGERFFYTTSKRMAGGLCELLLKIGHRPSIREREPSVTVKKDGSVIKGNHICYVISDCASTTSTVFKKETETYSGYVYDLTLERNHIMYVQRNGRCFWGSNCMCAVAPITLQGDEKKDYYRRVALGEDMSGYVSPNAITDVPDGYKEWIAANAERIQRADARGKLAWHLEDNREYWEDIVNNEMRPISGVGDILKRLFSSSEAAPDPIDLTPDQKKEVDTFVSMLRRKDRYYEPGMIDALNEESYRIIELIKGIKRGEPMSFKDADSGRANKYGGGDNCAIAVLAHELRIRGFDLTALPLKETPLREDNSKSWLMPSNGTNPYGKRVNLREEGAYRQMAKDVVQEMSKPGRYHVHYNAKGQDGHIICVDRLENGEIRAYDPQRNKKLSIERELSDLVSNKAIIYRVDNMIINPEFLYLLAPF